MRVLFVEYKTMFGGGQAVLVNLLREWKKENAPLDALVVCPPDAAIESRVRALDIPCQTMELGAVEKTRGVAWNFARRVAPTMRLWEMLRAFQPDVVCANGAFALLASVFAAKFARVPIVWFEHNNKPLPNERLLRWLLHQVRYAIVVSEMHVQQFQSLIPDLPDKVVLIHNGVDTDKFCAKENHVVARAEFGWTNATRVVGTVARLAPEKNMSLLLDAAQKILATMPDVKFLIVGDGPLRAELEHRAAANPVLQQACMFTGQRDDVARLLSAMDIFVLPSDAEAFPLAIVEAMAAARPVVATDVGGIRGAVIDDETGMLVPPREVNALADALMQLLRDKEKRRAMGERGRARVLEQFTIARQARAIQIIFERAGKR